jgi:hypothetical protein
MNLNGKLSITAILSITLLTGFLSIAYIQKVQAQVPGLDLSGIPGITGNPAFNFLKGPKGDKGDTGAQGPKGDKGDTGAQGPKGDIGSSASEKNLSIRTIKGDIVQNGFDGDDKKSIAECNSDEILTGGGIEVSGPGEYRILYSKPVDNTWEAKSGAITIEPSFTQAYAQCQKLVSDIQ